MVTVALFAALLVSAALAGQQSDFGGGGPAELVAFFGLIGLWGVANATVGAIIAWRRPGNRIGRILQAGGLLVIGVFLGFLIGSIRSRTDGPADLLGALAGWWASITIFPAILVAWPLVAILFPDGQLPGPRWRWPVALIAIGEIAISCTNAVTVGPVAPGLPDNPFGVLRMPASGIALLGLVGTLLVVLSLGLAFTAIGVRWRRGNRLARAQLKWLLGALALGGVLFPLGFGGEVVTAFDFLGVASATLVPISIGIAVLRYRLYEIDRIISRTISYGVLTAALIAVFASVVVGLQTILTPFTNGDTLPVAASTLVVFALFQPLRRRVQRAIDRRFDRARYHGEQTIAAFAARLRDQVDLESVVEDLRAVVGASLQPGSASIWIRSRNESRTLEA